MFPCVARGKRRRRTRTTEKLNADEIAPYMDELAKAYFCKVVVMAQNIALGLVTSRFEFPWTDNKFGPMRRLGIEI